ncbi:hypothetical protein C9975_01245 [Thalassospira xiamenensis]|nr:hypothetical protein C9939_00960 [Pseudidiomarina aestuarii]PTC01585.1 hypothetical protein C9975_01245 [Thalassospira xiamenensis]
MSIASDLLASAFEALRDIVIITEANQLDSPGPKIVYVNSAFEKRTGYARHEVIGKTPRLLQGKATDKNVLACIRKAMIAREPIRSVLVNYDRHRNPFWLEIEISPLFDSEGVCTHFIAIERDVTERKREEELRSGQQRALEKIALRSPLEEVLDEITNSVDRACRGCLSSILLIKDGRMFCGSSPGLPQSYNQAIIGKHYGPKAGSCGACAYLGIPVFVNDIANDPLWVDGRELALENNLAACWSVPVFDSQGKIVATFSLYSSSVREPLEYEVELLNRFNHIIAIAIEHQNNQEALQDSERKFREITDTIGEVFWIASPDRAQMLYVSPAYDVIWGRSREELYHNPLAWADAILPEYRNTFPVEVENIVENPHIAQYQIKRPDQSIRWIEDRSFIMYDNQGVMQRILGVARDITRQKAAELASMEQKEQFEAIVETTSDVVWDWDITSDRTWWSEGLERHFGIAPAEVQKSPEWFERIHPEDRGHVAASISKAIKSDKRKWSHEYRLIRPDALPLRVIDRGKIIRDQNGVATRAIGAITDITQQRDLEDRLNRSQRLEAIGQLTGGIAHDFNNLLTVIVGNAELITLQKNADRNIRSLAEMVQAAAEKGAQLTNHMLAFARRQPLHPQPESVGKLVRSMEKLLRRTLGEHIEIEINQTLDEDSAMIDGAQLESAILNLSLNARDAMPDGGKLVIETGHYMVGSDDPGEIPSGDYVAITVSDTGHGMDEETLGRVFEPFFTTKPPGSGTGLGLSTVFGFVKQSNGFINIYSDPDQGTTIRIYFPKLEKVTRTTNREMTMTDVPAGTETILVVEDDDMVRQHVVNQIESLGYTALQAANGPLAMEIIKSDTKIDLLFTDIIMPGGMNGRELAELAKEHRSGLCVLFTSGYTEDVMIHDGRLDQNVTLLSKPYRRQQLAEKIREVLSRKETS